MDTTLKTMIWQQYGAAIDMLGNAIDACPESLWFDSSQRTMFWYVAYHTLIFPDLYLSGEVEGFAPPAPFGLEEFDPAGVLPERPYTKAELQTYLAHCRRKCQTTIEALTDEQALRPFKFRSGEMPFLELQLYNMRHVQEHAAQLALILGDKIGWEPRWVRKAKAI